MKYWIFQNNEVCGPLDADDLAQLPGYSAEALVCPEGRKGTRMGDWQRAGMVPGLSISLVKASQLATAGKSSSPASAVYAGLPPEPTLKDLAALGSLQEKVALLESTMAQLQEGLQSKETELLSLHREIDVRKGIEVDLQGKLGEFEQRLAAVAQLRDAIDTAVAAEKSVETEVKSVESDIKGVEDAVHGVESTVQEVKTSISGVSGSVKDIESSLEKQRQTVADLMEDIAHLKSQRAAAPALPSIAGPAKPEPLQPMPSPALQDPAAPSMTPGASPFARQDDRAAEPPPVIERFPAPAPLPPSPAAPGPVPVPVSLDGPPPLRLDATPPALAAPPAPLFPAQPAAPALASSFGGAASGAAPKSDFPKGGALFSSPAKSGAPLAPPSLLPSLAPTAPVPSAPAPVAPAPVKAGAAPKPAIVDIAAGPVKPKSGKKGLVMSLVCFGLVAGGVLAFQAGLIPGLKAPPRRANPAASTPLPPPAEITPQAPSPEAQLDKLKQGAIDLVKSWPSSDKATLVGQRLEASAAPGGNPALSWMAEKLGEGTFQVNFYGSEPGTGKQAVYMFQADLGAKTVAPYNGDAAAKALLFGEPPAPAGKSQKVRVKPKALASGLPVAGAEAVGGPPAAVAGSGAAQEPAAGGDEAAAAPKQTSKAGRKAPRKRAGGAQKPAKPADDAQLLDQLLE
ncbi:MAG: hypothetical protein NTY77_04460 [Elusimicrobia bacterium]|nr:hypothetical protein [Elusimicrobiota bacterium]